MDIICLGQQNWDHCWTGKQQLTTRLAERGHRVLYVDPDLPAAETDDAIRAASVPGVPGLRRRGPGDLWTYTYAPIRRLGWRLNLARKPRMLPAVMRAIGFHAPLVLCLHPRQTPNLERIDASALVYYAVDEYTAYENMTDAERRSTRRAEEAILAASDVSLAVSESLRARFAATCREAHVLENGSDVGHFAPARLARVAPHPDLADLSGPVVGFVGQVDSRIDDAIVAGVAEARPDWTFVLAGRRTGAALPRSERLANVRFLGWQPYEALPSIARVVDAWTVPYVESEVTHACNPLKVYEYLATGKPVVSRPLDGLQVCRDVVSLAGDADAFRAALEAALADPEAGRAARLERARQHDWQARVDALEDHFQTAIAHARQSGRWFAAVAPLPRGRDLAGADDAFRRLDEYGARRDSAPARATWRVASSIARTLGGLRSAGRRRRPPRRILVLRLGHLGDLIALAPTLAHLRRTYPDAEITLGVQEGSLAPTLFGASPDVDAIETVDFAPWRTPGLGRAERSRRAAKLVAGGYDLVVEGAFWFFMEEGLLAGAPQAIGVYDGHPLQARLDGVLRRDVALHEADNMLRVAEAWTGRLAPEEARAPRLSLDEDVVSAQSAPLLDEIAPPPGGRLLLVHPGAKRQTRRTPTATLADALSRLLDSDPDLSCAITGTPGERDLARALRSALPARHAARVHDAVGRTGLLGLAGLLRRADAVLSNDTGVMHLARACGAPLVALFGPENQKLWGPHPVGRAPAVVLRRQVPCAPCLLESCAAHWCLRALPAQDIADAVREVLDAGRDGASPAAARVRRMSFSDLEEAGFALPRVVVRIEADPAHAQAVAAMAAGQTYPAIVVLGPQASPGEVEAVLARADYVVRARAGDAWPATRIARDVAAAVRAGVDRVRDARPLGPEEDSAEALVATSGAPPREDAVARAAAE